MFDEEMREYILKTFAGLSPKDVPNGLILWHSDINMIDQVTGEDCQGYEYGTGQTHHDHERSYFFSSYEDSSVLSFSYLPVEFLE